MSTGITLTIVARDIPDLAAQLLDLHHRFNGIGQTLREVSRASDDVHHGHATTLSRTPLENAFAAQEVAASIASPAPTTAAPSPVAPPEKKKRGAAKPAVKEPKDRFFEDEGGSMSAPETADAATEATEATENTTYADAMATEDAFANLRAKAKLYMDSAPEGAGVDRLRQAWADNWAFIIPEKADEVPGVKRLENNREAILRALTVFDTLIGVDPLTGEDVAGDPADDLLQ